MSNILKYSEELQKDMHIDELNVTQVAYVLPAVKHKWVARLIEAKRRILSLERQKKESREIIFNRLKNDNPLKLSALSIEKSIDSDDQYKNLISKIDEDIEDNKLLVLYLEKVENIFKNMTYDIKNIVDLNKLETT